MEERFEPIATLEEEHRVILKVVGAIAVLADTIDAGQDRRSSIEDVLTFLQNYVGKCHQAKEDEHLFPALAAKGVPTQGCPVGALVHEHQKLHALVEELSQAAGQQLRAATPSTVTRCLRELAGMYPGHIWKEDYLLFPLSRKVFSPSDLELLSGKFEQVEQRLGEETHARLSQLAERLHQDGLLAATHPV